MKTTNFYIRILALLLCWVGSLHCVWAKDIKSAQELYDYLGSDYVTISGNTVKLTKNITLDKNSEGLVFTEGTFVFDLGGYTLTYDRSSLSNANGDTDIAIHINGKEANITIKNGSITVKGQKGKSGSGLGAKGSNGANSEAIALTNGVVFIYEIKMTSTAGSGGSGGLFGSSGATGKAYTLYAHNKTVSDMLFGSYIVNGNTSNYTSEYIKEKSTEVKLSTYTVTFVPDGGIPAPESPIKYTLENIPTNFPTDISRDYFDFNGNDKLTYYDFAGWHDGKNVVTDKENYFISLMNTEGHQASVSKTLTAQWTNRNYIIKYNNRGGTLNILDPKTYKIDEDVILPTSITDGATFLGWKEKDKNETFTTIKNNQRDLSLEAVWDRAYTISFDCNGGTPATYDPVQTTTSKGLSNLKDYQPYRQWYDLAGWAVDNNIFVDQIPEDRFEKDITIVAQWTPKQFTIQFETNGGTTLADQTYNYFDEQKILTTKRNGYELEGWYTDEALTQKTAQDNLITTAEITDEDTKSYTLYAKWSPVIYKISYDTYNGKIMDTNYPNSYNTEEEVTLPTQVVRESFTFAGWYDNALLSGEPITKIEKGSLGDKTLYAKWSKGFPVIFAQPDNGKITVKHNGKEIKTGEMVGSGNTVTISATATTTGYALQNLKIGNRNYENGPQTITMPEDTLRISAVFVDARTSAPAPIITTYPKETTHVSCGENVIVTLKDSGNCDSLMYSIGGSALKRYTEPFPVTSVLANTVTIQAVSMKDGYQNGISYRDIIFLDSRVTITFNLPVGIRANNPQGGEVIEAIANGGTFEFRLTINPVFFSDPESLVVMANDTPIRPEADGVYRLKNQQKDVEITIKGLSKVTYTVTLVQSAHGHIYFTDEAEGSDNTLTACYGDTISITAEPDEDYKFKEWNDRKKENPRELIVEKDVTLQATFEADTACYTVILPKLEGATVKTLSGYSTEVKPGDKCKFWISLDKDYNNSELEVLANGELLEPVERVYCLYNIQKNIRIEVSGLTRSSYTLSLPEQVEAVDMETGNSIQTNVAYDNSMIVIHAVAPNGKVFSKWNDGKTENPRIVYASEASQVLPIFTNKTEETVMVKLPTLIGGGIAAVNTNAYAVEKGASIQLKLVILPAYSQSQVEVKVDNKVIEPSLSLRASSETRTLFYTLSNITTDTEVKVEGLELNNYTVTLEQQPGGTIRSDHTGLIKHGTVINLSATPDRNKMFVKWFDGNTLNPYPYKVTGNCTISSRFSATDILVNNEAICPPVAQIYNVGRTLYVKLQKTASLKIFSVDGRLVRQTKAPSGESNYTLPAGNYIVTIDQELSIKIVIR